MIDKTILFVAHLILDMNGPSFRLEKSKKQKQ